MGADPVRFGNIYWITSEGDIEQGKPVNVEGIGFFSSSTASTGILEFTVNGTPICRIVREKSTIDLPGAWQYLPINQVLSNLSASAVTACSGWLYLKTF